MMKAFAKGSDGKFHPVKVLGVCSCSHTLFPIVYVQALRGYPFNESQFAERQMRASEFYYEGELIPVTSIPQQYKTAGL